MSAIAERRDAAGNVRYRVRLRRGGQTFAGTFATELEAAAFHADALVRLAKGLGPEPSETPARPAPPIARAVTVDDAARRLCRGMRDGSVRTNKGAPYKPSTLRKYEEQLRCLVLPRIGGVQIASLTGGDLQRLVDGLASERTPEHARKALTALRVALRLAVRYGELDANPCAGVTVPVASEGEKPPRILTPEEASTIVAGAELDDARLARSFAAPLVILALASGLRLGELLALRWGRDGLDLNGAVVRVRASLDRVRNAEGVYIEHAPKSRAGRRDVSLPLEEVERLRRHRSATGNPPDGELVFATTRGQPLSPVPAYRAFKRACRAPRVAAAEIELEVARATDDPARIREAKAELAAARKAPAPRLHDCRHAFATHMLAAGLSAHAVAELLGHTDAGLVLRRYGHALPDEVAQAGARLSAWRRAREASN